MGDWRLERRFASLPSSSISHLLSPVFYLLALRAKAPQLHFYRAIGKFMHGALNVICWRIPKPDSRNLTG